MTEAETTGESKDGTGAGDHDAKFYFGNPRAPFKIREWAAKLLLLRGRVRAARDVQDRASEDVA